MNNLQVYYQVLECKPEDSFQTIKKRYRRLIKEYHPDRQLPGAHYQSIRARAAARFIEIQEAYEMIARVRSDMVTG